MSQTELLDSVRKGIEAAQNVAANRLTGIEDDARKVVSELVEKGRHGQRNLSQRLQRLAENEALRNRVRPVEDALKKLPLNELRAVVEKAVEDLGRRVGELQHTTRGFVEGASREQLLLVVRELRRVADLLANFVADQQDDEQAGEKAEVKKSDEKKAASKKPAAKKAAAQEATKAKPAAKKAASKSKEAAKPKASKSASAKSASAKSGAAKPATAKKATANKPAAKKASTSKTASAKAEKASPASKPAPVEAKAAATDAAKA